MAVIAGSGLLLDVARATPSRTLLAPRSRPPRRLDLATTASRRRQQWQSPHRIRRPRPHGPRHREEPRHQGLPAHGAREPQPQAARGPAGGGREGGDDQRRRRARRRHRVPVRDRRAAGRGDRQRQGRHRRVARDGLIVVDTSTSEPATTAKMREELAAKGVRFVDAPLARTPVEAEQGRLNIMVGADDATFAKLKPVLAAFCENIIHAGPPGHGLDAEAHQQLHRAGDRDGDGRGARRGGEVGAVDREAARGDLGRRRQLAASSR